MTRIRIAQSVLALLVLAGPARAQIHPLEDHRFIEAAATHSGITQHLLEFPPAPFVGFGSFLQSLVENPDPNGSGSSRCDTFQDSEIFSGGIQASGGTSGYWTIVPGFYTAMSLAELTFGTSTCVDYLLHAWVKPGTLEDACDFYLSDRDDMVRYHELTGGEIHTTGRLPSGEHRIHGRSSFGSGNENESGGTYAYQFTCTPCTNPLIASHALPRVVPCGSTTTFTVTTNPPPATLTFQWRRNGVALTQSTHTSGVNTASLTVTNACHADSGGYDVIVSDGTVNEPSRVARLTIGGTTDVGPGEARPNSLQLAIAGPNPFSREVSFRYTATRQQRVRVTVLDVTGSRVRTLADRELTGTGVLTWDGRTGTGARAPAGVYFVHVEAEQMHAPLRIVLLN